MLVKSEQLFRHRPLNLHEKQVRLLQIVQTNDEAAPVRIRLRHAILAKALDYNALSYTWGPENPVYDVHITDEDGSEGIFRVRENLYEFFQAARRPRAHGVLSQSWTDGWIWTDQICIDQANRNERCHQVNQMSNLYAATKHTIIWPGVISPPAHNIGTASHENTLQQFGDFQFSLDDLRPFFANHENRIEGRVVPVNGSKLRIFEMLSGDTLLTLLRKPYWTRLWIIQELYLSRYRGLLFLTTETYPMCEFTQTLHAILDLARKGNHDINEQLALLLKLVYILNGPSARLNRKYYSAPLDWEFFLRLGKGTGYTEPLDRIYAVMGLLHGDLRLIPDYTFTMQHLMERVIRIQVLAWETDYDIFCGKGIDEQWVNYYWTKFLDLMELLGEICGRDWVDHIYFILSGRDTECPTSGDQPELLSKLTPPISQADMDVWKNNLGGKFLGLDVDLIDVQPRAQS